MKFTNVIDHACNLAEHLESNKSNIHQVLRKCQSKEVVDDEIERSVEAMRHLSEIQKYFLATTLSQKTASFLPLNLPLYSFILFAAMPAYQSVSVAIRAPQRMRNIFNELWETLSLGDFYENVSLFEGTRDHFLTNHCKQASVVLFTGKYENYLKVRKECGKETLILFNGVGHNPLVITPSADIELAVEKTLKVKLFNNGQDCAGPDVILVHSSIVDSYLKKLYARLAQTRCATSYKDDDVVVGPLFESTSLLHAVSTISHMRNSGASISHGGQIDLRHNVMHPCVIRATLRQYRNYIELYSPLILVTEYEHDHELAAYFNDTERRYYDNQMYVSLFGESDQIAKMRGDIILKDRTIHDLERGTEEYGGYGPGASSVSYKGLRIPKPLLIPREIHNFLGKNGQTIFANIPKTKGNWEQYLIVTQFQEVVQQIFGDELVFAYIFGSFASEEDKQHSDVDTLVCVKSKIPDQVEPYLQWLFNTHEMFGRIPDFKYPTEIVLLSDLERAVNMLSVLELKVAINEAVKYDAMIWCHSLSQQIVGVVRPENIPPSWKEIFPTHSARILRSFLSDLEQAITKGINVAQIHSEIHEIPRQEPALTRFIDNLNTRGLVSVLKMIPFEEVPVYSDQVLRLVLEKEFMGRRLFKTDSTEHLFDQYFRYGVVSPYG